MHLEKICNNYFNCFQEIKNKNGNKPLAALKIASMFTIIAPLVMGCLLGGAKLSRRFKKLELVDPKVNRLSSLAKASFSNNNKTSASAINERLDNLAITQGFGYKAANLMILQEQAEEMSAKLFHTQVKVPPFKPFSDLEIRNYLGAKSVEIDDLWRQFQNTFKGQKQNLSEMQISEEGKRILEEIRNKIIEAFSNETFQSEDLNQWLKDNHPERLIIRSTGKEDSDTNSNAGGNESIPFIRNDLQEISRTMGLVLASYFGEKSIEQRLQAEDSSLFADEKPFLPVLLQEMVLEANDPKPEEILRSGVFFTYQSEQARNVTVIQTGLGNNEGIVTSQVAVDSYYIDEKAKIHTVVRDKKTRFVQVEEEGHFIAKEIQNGNHELQRSQALPNKMVRDLKIVADHLSDHYGGKALDVEYSVKLGNENTVYLFQTRPLVPTKQTPPSYLDLSQLDDLPKENKMGISVLIDSQHAVRNLTSEEEVLFSNDLKEAYKDYLRNPQKIQTIFVRKSAPSTSHEAVVLRAKGVTVVVLPDPEEYARAERLLEFSSKTNPVKLDPQHGVLIATQGFNIPEGLEVRGTVSYPILREVSIPQVTDFTLKSLQESEKNYKALIKSLLNGQKTLPTKGDDPFTLHSLLDLMATGNEKEAKQALATLLVLLHKTLKRQIKGAEPYHQKYNARLINLFQYALKLSKNEIIPALGSTKPQSMERLYPIKFLEAILFQQPSNDTIVTDSFAKSLLLARRLKKAVAQAKNIKIKKLNEETLNLLMIGEKAAFSKETADKWGQFIARAAPNLQELAEHTKKLAELGLFTSWINLEFGKIASQSTISAVTSSMEKAIQENEAVLKWIGEKKPFIASEEEIAKWGNPQYAIKSAASFKERYNKELGMHQGSEFVQIFQQASPIGKLALLEFQHEVISSYDLVIKQVTGSTQFPSDRQEQARLFADLLEGYFEMMKATFDLPTEKQWRRILKTKSGEEMNSETYSSKLLNGGEYEFCLHKNNTPGLKGLNSRIQNRDEPLEDLFHIRPQFNVEAFLIGSGHDLSYGVHWPATLEEYFTAFHQNMEYILNYLKTQNGMNKDVLGGKPKAVCEAIEKQINFDGLSTISMVDKGIELGFNIPLRQHAAFIGLKFNPEEPTKPISLSVKAAGVNEMNRWYKIAFAGALLNNSHFIGESNGAQRVCLDWNANPLDVVNVTYELAIPPNANEHIIIDRIKKSIKDIITYQNTSPTEILQIMGIRIETINPHFFSECLWGAKDLLEELAKEKKFDVVAQGIRNHILAVIKAKPPSYDSRKTKDEYWLTPLLPLIEEMLKNDPNSMQPIIEELIQKKRLQDFHPQFLEDIRKLLKK